MQAFFALLILQTWTYGKFGIFLSILANRAKVKEQKESSIAFLLVGLHLYKALKPESVPFL